MKQPLTAAGLHALRDQYTRTIAPARALAAETLTLERTLSDLVNQAYALTPAEIDLMWKTAPPRMAHTGVIFFRPCGCYGGTTDKRRSFPPPSPPDLKAQGFRT